MVLYPAHPVKISITGTSENGKSCFLTKLTLYIMGDFEKCSSTHYLYIKIYIRS